MKERPKLATYISYAILLTLFTFIVLKVIGVINWSWIWVISPLWIAALINIFAIIMIAALMMLMKILLKIASKRINKDLKEL